MSTKTPKSNNHTKLPIIKMALLGLGLDNQALLNLLIQKKFPAELTICDTRAKKFLNLPKNLYQNPNLKISFRLEDKAKQKLGDFDILFRSPGWPLNCPGLQAALKNGRTQLSSSLALFLSLSPSHNIIGVTGTKGKGTTASLIYQILRDAKKKVWLGGNIGIAPVSFLTKIKPKDYVVLELSSFQLEDLPVSPKISVLTNLYHDHLSPADPHNPNFHASFPLYWQAKLQIAKNITNKYFVVNKNLATKVKAAKLPGKIIYFTKSSLPSKLTGDYNRENVAAAVAVAEILKIKKSNYQKTIANFKNLEHRLEFCREINKIKYFDNSFSTNPDSTILDLLSFPGPIIQIAGGADKGADFKLLAKKIKQKVKFLILLKGAATPRLRKELLTIGFPRAKLSAAASMEQAVKLAAKQALPGDTVLLSTACASFGMFKNYKERGNLFKKYVKEL